MIENIRGLHSEIDRGVSNIVIELQHKEKRQKRIVHQNHRINDHLLSIQEKSSQLLQLYHDPHHIIRDEIKDLTAPNLQETMRTFDQKYLRLLQFHQNKNFSDPNSNNNHRGPGLISEREDQKVMRDPFAFRMNKQKEIPFSVEEHYGKYLDLHHFFQLYLNLYPSNNLEIPKNVDYFTYLKIFPLFHRIDFKIRKSKEYFVYLKQMYEYLLNFHKRTQPLANISHVMKSTDSFFEETWAKGELHGWKKQDFNKKPTKRKDIPPPPPLLIGKIIKEKPDLTIPQISNNNNKPKKRKRKRKRKRKNNSNQDIYEKYKEVAYLETKISRFLNLLSDHLDSTREQISKKSVRTYSEFQMELEREEEKENELPEEFQKNKNDDDEDPYAAMCSNPLNLPMGWDGKPIPYWLYKIYNLGQEYKCEICGNYSYWGRRAFDRHFQEWRHSHGMKCLGIPNTKHFHFITKISSATKLWDKMKSKQKSKTWEEDMEEFEDNQGNVYSRKTYEELKRQGILGN